MELTKTRQSVSELILFVLLNNDQNTKVFFGQIHCRGFQLFYYLTVILNNTLFIGLYNPYSQINLKIINLKISVLLMIYLKLEKYCDRNSLSRNGRFTFKILTFEGGKPDF